MTSQPTNSAHAGRIFFGNNMRKTIALLLALWTAPALAVGTIPGISLSQQLDTTGKPLGGALLYLIQAGTTSTPQNCYQDTGLSIAYPNPVTLDAYGRAPQLFCADGNIKVRLTTSTGVQVFVQDNLLIVGASSGGGGGGTVDPTTILATGDFKLQYNTGPIAGFVRCNGRTIGSQISGGVERSNADTSALFAFLWNADPNLAVSSGRGVSAAADFAANKTITLPDCRGRSLFGLDDMGNSAAGRLTATYFGTGATTLGAAGGTQSSTLLSANLPPYTPVGTIGNGAITFTAPVTSAGSGGGGVFVVGNSSSGNFTWGSGTGTISQASSSFTGTAQGGTSTPVAVVSPGILTTIFIKL